MIRKALAYLKTDSGAEHNEPLRIAIVGATGSIGRQAVDIAAAHPDRFDVKAITVNRNVEGAADICRRVKPKLVVVADSEAFRACAPVTTRRGATVWAAGSDAIIEAVTRDDVDMVLTATVGYSGLLPTVAAIRAGKDIALANKETLVVAGDVISREMQTSPSKIFPVDSEHSAVAQCLTGEDCDNVDRLILTASGGPFRTWSMTDMARITASDALKHPNWNMGAKITVDSATMMNKAFEIIEAYWLFGLDSDRITALVHPQSIVHSMVQFTDGAIKAQLGVPDMHLPIAYALGMNHRLPKASRRLTLSDMSQLTFEEPDPDRFPCLRFASLALDKGGNTACVINAANEIAVDAFLKGKLRFIDIPELIEQTLARVGFIAIPTLDDLVATNTESRRVASERLTLFNA